MQPVLVYVEERDSALVPGSVGLLSKARELGSEPVAVLCGSRVSELAADLGRYGASRVLVAEDPVLDGPLAHPRVDVLARVIEENGFEFLLFENSSLTADIAAALAARLEVGVNWDLSDLRVVDGDLVGMRHALRDTVLVDVAWTRLPGIAVLRGGVLEPQETGTGDADIEAIEVLVDDHSLRVRIVDRTDSQDKDTALDRAKIIVAGGRGLDKRENLRILEDLADALGGAVAVTMPLVDRGWYPHSHQVGQTGRSVRPRLYIACGISGAIQHRVGMEKSGHIVAINTDPTAPIFGFCDVGVVGDVLDIVPKLTKMVRDARNAS